MNKLTLLCGMLVAAAYGSSCFGWEGDVHFGLTLFLAEKTGFDLNKEALVIATANQSQDETDNAAIGAVISSACLPWATDAKRSNQVRIDHFPEANVAPNTPQKRKVEPYSKTAMDRVNSVNASDFGDSSKRKAGLEDLGKAIHALQDTWSHQGTPDIPGVLFIQCDENLAWGHPQNRGGWNEHLADLTHMDGLTRGLTDKWPNYDGTYRYLFSCGTACEWKKDATREMAHATLAALVAYFMRGSNLGKNIDQHDVNARVEAIWATLENEKKKIGEIDKFREGETIDEKRTWFWNRGIKKTDFLNRIDLPDHQKPPPPVERKSRADNSTSQIRRVALDYKGAQLIPDDVEKFLGKFLESWSTSTSVGDLEERIVSQYIQAASFAQSVCGRGNNEVPANIRYRVAKFLAIWRYSNHGYSAHPNLSHGRIDLCGNASLEILPAIQEDLRMNSARVTHVSLASLDDRGIEGDNFVAQVRFEHAPMDTILLHIKKGRGDEYGAAGPWKITGFSWSVEY